MTQISSDPVIDKIVRSLNENSAAFARARRWQPVANVFNRIARFLSIPLRVDARPRG